jgi:hypothetical protein
MQFHGLGPGHILLPQFRLGAPRGCPLAHSRRTGASHPADLLPLSDRAGLKPEASMRPEGMANRSHALHLPYRTDIVLPSYKLQCNPTIIHEIASTFLAMITSFFEIGGIAPNTAPCLVIACPPNNNPHPRCLVPPQQTLSLRLIAVPSLFVSAVHPTNNKRRPREARQ